MNTWAIKTVLSYQPANSKLTYLAAKFRIQEDVLWFKITMDNLFRFGRVQEAKGTRDFSYNACSDLPCQRGNVVFLEKAILEAPIGQVLVYKRPCFWTCTKQSHQMRMLQFAQNLDLVK
jgi:hypothetical protein